MVSGRMSVHAAEDTTRKTDEYAEDLFQHKVPAQPHAGDPKWHAEADTV